MAQKVPLRPPPFLGVEEKRQETEAGKAEGTHSTAYTAPHQPHTLRKVIESFWLVKTLKVIKSNR